VNGDREGAGMTDATVSPETNSATLMADFEAALARALGPLEFRIQAIEAQLAIFATKQQVSIEFETVRNQVQEATKIAIAASADATESRRRVDQGEASFKDLKKSIHAVTGEVKEAIAGFAGQMQVLAIQRDERLDALDENNRRQDTLLTAQGQAIGEVNTQAAVQEERYGRLVADMERLTHAVIANNAMIAVLARPGMTQRATGWTVTLLKNNPRLALVTIGLAALAVVAIAAPELVPALYKLLTGQ